MKIWNFWILKTFKITTVVKVSEIKNSQKIFYYSFYKYLEK